MIVAKLSELPNYGKKVVSIDGSDVLLVNLKGKIYAFENECPHQGAPMSAAVIKDQHISCPRHGYRFNLEDGKCIDHPEFSLKVYNVEINGENVIIPEK